MDRNFDLAMLALKSLAPNNEILYDNAGLPSVMVRIPKMTYAELGMGDSTDVHPAFIVNGVVVPEIYISKYQNCVYDGKAYSLPARKMNTNVSLDNAIARCAAKGAGWHLMTALEWGLIAQWCLQNNTQPRGNNNYGRDADETLYSAIPFTFEDDGKRQKVLTGTGPLSWSHDGTPAGIWDLNGNVYEWQGGIRLVYGEVQVLVNNNAADSSHSQAADSADWKAINGADGTFITPNGQGTTEGSVKMRWRTNPSRFEYTTDPTPDGTSATQYGTFERNTIDNTIGDAAKRLLQALCLYKVSDTSGAYKADSFYMNTSQEERSIYRGGNWGSGAGAGLFFSYGTYARSSANGYVGFRAAYVKL